jgi:hypothetical protein
LALEDYWYEDGLPRVVAVLGDDGLSVVLPWLEAYEHSKGYFSTIQTLRSCRAIQSAPEATHMTALSNRSSTQFETWRSRQCHRSKKGEVVASCDKNGSDSQDHLVRTGGGDQTKR